MSTKRKGRSLSANDAKQNADMAEFVFDNAVAQLRQGRLPAAEDLLRRLLAQHPTHGDALQFLGIIEYQKGQFEAAAEHFQEALRLAPKAPGLHCNLGLTLQQLGRHEQALACLDQALTLKPDSLEATNNRANVLRDLNRMDEAAASYRHALRRHPAFFEARYNLGLTLLALNQLPEALECLHHCLRLAPQHADVHLQIASTLMKLKRPAEALPHYKRVLDIAPDNAEAHCGLGGALLETGALEQAMASYRRAVQLRPDVPESHYNIGTLLLEQNRPEDALSALDQALQLRPGYAEALYNKGAALEDLHRFDEAATTYERLLSEFPDHRYTLGKLFSSRQFACDWSSYADSVEHLTRATAAGEQPDMPFSFLAVSADPALQLRCAADYTTSKYPPSATPLYRRQRHQHNRIRVAYLSADFREHPLCYLLAGVFESHDRERFEIFGFALKAPDGSPMEQRIRVAFDQFIDVSAMNDADAAALILKNEIDIAVHLTGFTQDNRSAIFAARPAPIQINYLGYPGTMGADYIDYILADEFVIPRDSARHYAEQVVYLPDCYQANDDKRLIAEQTLSRTEAGLPESGFVFCAFNTVNKLTPVFFDIWMRLLSRVPDSVLWLANDSTTVQKNLRAEAEKRGVSAHRLAFSPRLRYADHLARLRHADLFLDTLPFNAGTTASDALWAGVPVLTCAGEAFAARMAGSLLQAVGLPELITTRLEDYEALALKLSSTPELLSVIRDKLAHNRLIKPLFDTSRFCRHLERAFAEMKVRHERGEAPASFDVTALPSTGY